MKRIIVFFIQLSAILGIGSQGLANDIATSKQIGYLIGSDGRIYYSLFREGSPAGSLEIRSAQQLPEGVQAKSIAFFQRYHFDRAIDVLVAVGSDGKFYEQTNNGEFKEMKVNLPDGVLPAAASR